MIATLEGTITDVLADTVVLSVHGVGYGLFVTTEDFARLSRGTQTKLYVYEHIRETQHDLFGFVKMDDKKLFEQLLSVKNVGPKVALSVLDIGSSDTVRGAIASGDVKMIQTAKGVGKRAAEQIVVELRDKVGLVSSLDAENIVNRGGVDKLDDAVQALVALGYQQVDAVLALEGVDKKLPTEERVKQALKGKA